MGEYILVPYLHFPLIYFQKVNHLREMSLEPIGNMLECCCASHQVELVCAESGDGGQDKWKSQRGGQDKLKSQTGGQDKLKSQCGGQSAASNCQGGVKKSGTKN